MIIRRFTNYLIEFLKRIYLKIFPIILIIASGAIILILSYSFISRIISPPIESHIDEHIQTITPEEKIQISILNACGTPLIAEKAKKYLRQRDFDVVRIGNLDSIVANSYVIDRLGDRSSAHKVAYAMGIGDSMIITKIDSNKFLRSSVVLGRDYYLLKPYK